MSLVSCPWNHETVLSGKLRKAIGGATNREGGGVSGWRTNEPKPVDRLQKSSGRITRTYVSHPWKIPFAQHSRSMRTYPKWYPSTSQLN